VIDQLSYIGRLVQSKWRDDTGRSWQETCLVVDDRPGEVTLYPLGPLSASALGHHDSPRPSLETMQSMARRPMAFDAAKLVRVDEVLFFARGHEYRLVGDRN
jgi:hypothetical protein